MNNHFNALKRIHHWWGITDYFLLTCHTIDAT